MVEKQWQVRSSPLHTLLIVATLILGLASCKFSQTLPWWMAKNAGDIPYAVLAFWMFGFLAPTLSTLRIAFLAALFCVGIEFL